jgi:hypothetical protein
VVKRPDGYTLRQLADRLGVSYDRVWDWVHNGVRGVKLGAEDLGGRLYVTDAGYEAFRLALAARRERDPDRPDLPSARQLRAEHEAAVANLRRRGMME